MNKQIDDIYQQVIDEDCANPLYRFAELVRQDEREACAKLCDKEKFLAYHLEAKYLPHGNNDILRIAEGASRCAHLIRARGNHG